MMVAQVTNLRPGEFIHTLGDVHLYLNHREQAVRQLERKPHPLPTMKLNPEVKHIDQFQFADFHLEEYLPHPFISAPVAI